LTAYLNYRVDEVIVAMLLPAEQLGFYVIAVGLAERLWILPGAVTSALLPHLTNRRERDPQISVAVARHVMIWIGLICIGVFVFAGLGIRLLYSSAYEGSIAPLRWLLPGIFTLSLGKVLVTELLAQEKPRYTVWASGIAAFVNIAANLVLVPRIGISGAALASSISYTVLSVILMWLFVRETGVSWTAFLIRQSDFTAYSVLWRQWRPSLKRLRLA
jgi:O-antigen/teichoic acid export membrane protein